MNNLKATLDAAIQDGVAIRVRLQAAIGKLTTRSPSPAHVELTNVKNDLVKHLTNLQNISGAVAEAAEAEIDQGKAAAEVKTSVPAENDAKIAESEGVRVEEPAQHSMI